jgi:hypothetical protein
LLVDYDQFFLGEIQQSGQESSEKKNGPV